MGKLRSDEWGVLQSLLPDGWRQAARELGAFRRARNVNDPSVLLRLLLFHAVNDAGLRATAAQAHLSGIATVSQVALLKRMRTAGKWLARIGAGLCGKLREQPRVPLGLRPRVIDSTTVQGPASKGTQWRLHYALDLATCSCDWFELTDASAGEALERTPLRQGDVLLADRNYLRPASARATAAAGAHLLIRMRWSHPHLRDARQRRFNALNHALKLRVGRIGDWPVSLIDPKGAPVQGRVVATRLPSAVAQKTIRRIQREARRKGKSPDPRSLKAAQVVLTFTTLPTERLSGEDILELYRYRWQVELAFKRLKQLLRLGHLPHKDPLAAQAWILAKLVIALLLETLYRNARSISPWGYNLQKLNSPA